jgi:hypothetical protein
MRESVNEAIFLYFKSAKSFIPKVYNQKLGLIDINE